MKVHFVRTSVFPQGLAPSEERRVLQVIELCGRTAYKSEDRITEDSARSFVLMLKNHGHLSVLEHSNIALKIQEDSSGGSAPGIPSVQEFYESLRKIIRERAAYHRTCTTYDEGNLAFTIAANLRGWIETLEYLKQEATRYYEFLGHHLGRTFPALFQQGADLPDDFHYNVSIVPEEAQLELLRKDPRSDLPVFLFKFICDRGITHEIVRHRVLSFTQESTRYVNYRNKGMTLILPEELESCYDESKGTFITENPQVLEWRRRGEVIFEWYQSDIARGLRPEIARDVLPNLLKSEIFVSGRWSGWRHFISLRDSKQAHPRIRLIAREVRQYFESLGLPTT
ncbi:MAG: FAD-dependent thymidylate synthase [Deltaproteobacteria bacterium]|nr:FAD-dependent thymidylate synthase [Deltaproteobacteria bacterium]